MEVTLVVIRGKVSRGEIAFQPPAVLGRSREADLTFAHPMISRQHCELYEVDGLLMVRDLGSLNGTVVNQQRVVEAALCPDDSFSVGPLSFKVQYEYSGDRDAIPPPKPAEPGAGETPAATPVADEPRPIGPPVFSEIGSPATGRPASDEGPWSDPVPSDDDGPWADAMPADEEPEFIPRIDPQPAETPPAGEKSFEPTLQATSERSADDTEGDDDRDAGVDEEDAEPAAAASSKATKEKRGWMLWPFGGRKRPQAIAKETPAAVDVVEAADAEEPDEVGDAAPARDTRHDEAVADFLAGEPEPDEPEPEPEPDQEEPADGEDDAFQDFLKGLQ